MLKEDITPDTRVTVMGLGLFGGGVGAAKYFARNGAQVTVTDLRTADVLQPSIDALQEYRIKFTLGEHLLTDFTGCDLLVINPAVKPGNKYVEAALAAGVPVTTEIGTFISNHTRNNTNSILAVTGSNGKSTTTSLLAAILQTHNSNTLCGGNIGGSLLDQEYSGNTPAVLELSSFQLHYLRAEKISPAVSVITNLSPNHLDWHGDITDYTADKKVITEFQNADDVTILNYNDRILREWSHDIKSHTVFTSLQDCQQENAAFIHNNTFILRYMNAETALAPVEALQLPGNHNKENALQALTAAYLFSHDLAAGTKGLQQFTGLQHRQETVARSDKVSFINDSIATTPESTIAALNSYSGKKITIIAGGYDKGIDLTTMAEEIATKACNAVLIGQTGKTIFTAIKNKAPEFPAILAAGNDFDSIIEQAYELCPEGIVLLSPGCASYGMFTNFTERGEKFSHIAREIIRREMK